MRVSTLTGGGPRGNLELQSMTRGRKEGGRGGICFQTSSVPLALFVDVTITAAVTI